MMESRTDRNSFPLRPLRPLRGGPAGVPPLFPEKIAPPGPYYSQPPKGHFLPQMFSCFPAYYGEVYERQSFDRHGYYCPGNIPVFMRMYGRNSFYHPVPWPSDISGAYPYFYSGSKEQEIPVEILWQNPLQPPEQQTNYGGTGFPGQINPYGYPYPKPVHFMKPPTGLQSVINSFKTQDGTLDIKKMIDTAGQMAYAVNQVQTLVKGLGGIFKT